MTRAGMRVVLAALAVGLAPATRAGDETNGVSVSIQGAPAGWAGRETFINFSFDEVAIPTFVRLVGEITGRKFVVADDVDGKITVISPKIRRDEAYPLFVSILESAGCSVLQDGDLYRVVPMPERQTPMAPIVGADEELPSDGIVTKVFRLKHVSATELRKMLEPKIRGGKLGAVGVLEETNHLIVTDTAETIRRVERIIAEIDQPGLTRVTELVSLQFASAEEVARELNMAMAQGESAADQLRRRLPAGPAESSGSADGRRPVVVASTHANSLLLVGTASQIEELKGVIAKVDIDSPAGRGRLNAIFLKYIKAEEAAKSLKGLLGTATEPAAAGTVAGVKAGRDIGIEPSPENNALLVDANPGDFEVVRKLVDQLDRMPEQVHIEVLIAEITTGDSLDLGVSMAALDLPGKAGDYTVQGSSTVDDENATLMNSIQDGIFPGGLTLGVAHGTRVDSAGNVVVGYPGVINISAIKKDTRFNVRSNPSLMAQNNREATVSIVNEIPILTSTIQGGSGTSRDVIQNIERVDVGIKLKLTPRIIPGGEVQMELSPSIEAVIDPGVDAQGLTPTIAKREVTTTVTVRDGEVIVIAGLTREDRTSSVSKVPLLGSLPLVGWLFRHTVEGVEKSNVLIFVTPTIVRSSADVSAVLTNMTERTGLPYHAEEP